MTRLSFIALLLCLLLQINLATADESIVLTGNVQMRPRNFTDKLMQIFCRSDASRRFSSGIFYIRNL